MTTLCDLALSVLTESDAKEKIRKSHAAAELWRDSRANDNTIEIGSATPPLHPSRPASPELLDPKDMPRRRRGGEAGRVALVHAIAHIELNAVDLHWDAVARYTSTDFPIGYYDDWVSAADDESKHFTLLSKRLEAMGSFYGALPAHAGMWRAAEDTVDDILGRLAVVPMVLEARGLDVTPGMITAFDKAGDSQTVAALEIIYREEVAHVAYGSKWFNFLCGRFNFDPKDTFHSLVQKYFNGPLKPPFNEPKRADAGLPPDFYWPLTDEI
ncbi:MAG: ferritin-like domain-containing protein [Pikeienuella sp.]